MDSETVSLGSDLNIDSIQSLKKKLVAALKKKKNIVFQAEKIMQVDTAGLQLLLSFTQQLTQLNLNWEWQEPSMCLIYRANILGMSHLLKLRSF